jgi:uncharacterized iron-regulated protein
MRIRLWILILTLLPAGLAFSENLSQAAHPLAGKIWDTNSRRFIDEATLVGRMERANVILLGETHDNPVHHDIQLRLLREFIGAGFRPALLMEQLDSENQEALDRALAQEDKQKALDSASRYIKFSDWKFYRPLLATAVENKLPVIAANISSQQLQPVIWHGFPAYDADAIKRVAVETVWSDSREQYMLRHIGGAHCGQVRDSLREGLVRSQRLRDALMADAGMGGIGRGVVAIVGSSHARRDVGMPLYLGARAPSAHILSIGLIEAIPGWNAPEAYERESASGSHPFDLVWFTPRVERADPCAALRTK